MLSSRRSCGALAALFFSFVLLGGAAAGAAPLGLLPGDLIDQLEWSNDNSGGAFSTGSPGTIDVDGDIQSVTVNSVTTNTLGDVTFTIDFDLQSHGVFPLGGNQVAAIVNLVGSSAITPDFTVSDTSGVILEGNLAGVLSLAAFGVNVLNPGNPSLDGSVGIVITGGDTSLVAALGGLGGTGTLDFAGGIFNFAPGLSTILGDLNLASSNYTFSGSGIITPDNAAPFVPEPSTALLLGGGLIGLIGVSRRLQKH